MTGTVNLAKTLDVWLDAARTVLKKCGVNLSDRTIAISFGAFRAMWKVWGVNDADAALLEADALAKKVLPDVELYPDTLEVLEALNAKGKQLALITTSRHDNIQHLLDKYNLNTFFRVIIAGDDIMHYKPHPESLKKALKALDGNPT